MSTAGAHDDTPVTRLSDLAEWMAAGCKPPEKWRIGTEHEKFGFNRADHRPLPYDGEGPTVRKLLEGLVQFGWEPLMEGPHIVGLKRDDATIALEPGGQFELSGAPLEHLHQTCAETGRHLSEVRQVADDIGAGFLGLGFAPTWSLDETPVMPKGRYTIMRGYMPKVGRLGREMMLRTCTVQVNLDYETEADMVAKLRVSLALQSVATALFANSPFAEGRPSGWLSLRAFIWADTDNDRSGTLPVAFEQGFGFERYAEWALDVPMYFLRREGRFIDVSGGSFRAFMEGRLPGFEGQRPTLGDWEDHLSTLFPDARVKRFIEMRGADSGPWSSICALPAFWVGLLYDAQALAEASELVADWTGAEREALRLTAPKLGLAAPFRSGTLREIAVRALEIARGGLSRRARLNLHGEDETLFLAELEAIARSGVTPADELLALWRGSWGRDIDRVFQERAY